MSVAFVKTHSQSFTLGVEVNQWITDALNTGSSRDDIETRATNILKNLQNSNLNKTRYRFEQTNKREEVFKLLFDKSFQKAPFDMIDNAEKLHPSQTPFYPLWKRVCWIDAPIRAAAVLDNTLFKIVLTIVTYYYFIGIGRAVYIATTQLTTSLVGRVTPFLINNIPIQAIRLGNSLLDVRNWLDFRVVIYCWIGQRIITHWLPEIPYVTPFVREISFWEIYMSFCRAPETAYNFVSNMSYSAATFTWNNCNQVSYFLRGRAQRAMEERFAICKAKTYEIWKSAVLANAPAA